MEIWRAINSPNISLQEHLKRRFHMRYAIIENSGNHDFFGLERNHGAVEVSAFWLHFTQTMRPRSEHIRFATLILPRDFDCLLVTMFSSRAFPLSDTLMLGNRRPTNSVCCWVRWSSISSLEIGRTKRNHWRSDAQRSCLCMGEILFLRFA